MRSFRFLAPLFALVVLIAVAAPNARATDPQNWDSFLTFTAPVVIPGMVLTAGTYEFKLVDFENLGYLVEVRNAKGTLLETVYGVPTYRSDISDKTVVTLKNRGSNEPEAVTAWFYPDRTDGVEFVYPKSMETNTAASTQ